MIQQIIFTLLITGILSLTSMAAAESVVSTGDLDIAPGSSIEDSSEDASPEDASVDAAFLAEEFLASTKAPVPADERVAAQIEYFITSGKPSFQNWLDHSSRFLPLMKDIFRDNKLPEDLVYVAMIESGLRMNAVSRSQAVGPWQFMSVTARIYGLKMDEWVDERMDPVKSTRAAAAYLSDLYKRFNSWPLALASYNAGAGRIKRALFLSQESGLPSLYDSRILRRETRDYVPRLLAAVMIARNPEHYGFSVNNSRSFSYDEVRIEESTDLQDVAALVGCTFEDIRDLNPELKSRTTPPYVDYYLLRLPIGTKENYLAARKMLFPSFSLITPRFDVVGDLFITGRPPQYAVLRKRDPFRTVFRVCRRQQQERSTSIKHRLSGEVSPAGSREVTADSTV